MNRFKWFGGGDFDDDNKDIIREVAESEEPMFAETVGGDEVYVQGDDAWQLYHGIPVQYTQHEDGHYEAE